MSENKTRERKILEQDFASFGSWITEPNDGEPAALHREREAGFVLKCLDEGGSCLIVGPSGCGKTALITEASRLWRARGGPAPGIFRTSPATILAGTKWLGEWQTRVKNLVDAAIRHKVVLVCEEIYTLMKSGSSSNSDASIGSFVLPYLERGAIRMVGECTPHQFRNGIEREPGFEKAFRTLRVQEPPREEAIAIARQVIERQMARVAQRTGWTLGISESFLKRLIELSGVAFPGQVMPGKVMRLWQHVLTLEVELRQQGLASGELVAEDRVVTVLERLTGMPSRLIDDSQALKPGEVQAFLESRVLGQAEAVETAADVITMIKAGVTEPGKPLGVLLFVGPTGVGKTELAKALAEYIFGSADRLFRFDMSEYKDYYSYRKLIGNPEAKESSVMETGSLISKVRQQPFSVILFDEIEKGHENIFDLFLQLFDDGRLSDPSGNVADFSQSIIIMTSNIGSDSGQPAMYGFGKAVVERAEDRVQKAMRDYFRPEFIGRIGKVVVFRRLDRKLMRTLVQRELDNVLLRGGITRRRMRLDIDPGVYELLLEKGFSEHYGARALKRAVQELILAPLARKIVGLGNAATGSLVRLAEHEGEIRMRVSLESAGEEKAGPVKVFDAARQKTVRLTPPMVREGIEALGAKLRAVEEKLGRAAKEAQRESLLAEMGAPDFWQNGEESRAKLSEIHQLERELEPLVAMEKQIEEMQQRMKALAAKPNRESLAGMGTRTHQMREHMQLLEFAAHCTGARERAGAIVEIALLGSQAPAQGVVEFLGDMYQKYCAGKGWRFAVMHEEMEGGVLRGMAAKVDALMAYGILSGEQGTHEFQMGKRGEKSQEWHLAEVTVWPLAEEAHWRPEDVAVQVEKCRGQGHWIKQLRTRATARHRPTGVQVVNQNELDAEAARRAALSRLRAQVESPRAEAGDEPPIRKYVLGPRAVVKDRRTGLTFSRVKDLLEGGLDEMLMAWLNRKG